MMIEVNDDIYCVIRGAIIQVYDIGTRTQLILHLMHGKNGLLYCVYYL